MIYSQTYKIVDTGVVEFYSDNSLIEEPITGSPFYGQDAHYNGNQPSYTDNGDGTITDNITGLMWEENMGEKITYEEAKVKAENSNLGGYDDWRIPTIKELYSLALFTGRVMGDEVIDKFIDTDYFNQPIGDTSIGEREIDAQTWSSTHYVATTMSGDSTLFGFNFVDGRLKGYPKFQPPHNIEPRSMYFRMVRGNISYGVNQFIDNGDGTISDLATGLMWQKSDDGERRDWEESLLYAENLELGGYDDWRLPNIKELQSIVDYTRSPTTSNSPAIDPLFESTEIDDPNGNGGTYGYYWSSSPLKDGVNPYSQGCYIAFGKAQGMMNGNLLDVHGAGASRSDPKSGDSSQYPQYHGPQGDLQYVYNFVRAVRTIDTSNIEESDNIIPDVIKLEQNYPNPFNPTTEIGYDLKILDSIEEAYIKFYNSKGEEISSLKLERSKGKITFDGSTLHSGNYYYSLIIGDRRLDTKSMILIK